MPTFPDLSEKNLIFDMLHGLLNCVKDQFVYLLNDLQLNNPDLFLEPLHEVFNDFPYLSELNVAGRPPGPAVSALCGNGCVTLMQNLERILERLFGKHDFDVPGLLEEEEADSSQSLASSIKREVNETRAAASELREAAGFSTREGEADAFKAEAAALDCEATQLDKEMLDVPGHAAAAAVPTAAVVDTVKVAAVLKAQLKASKAKVRVALALK